MSVRDVLALTKEYNSAVNPEDFGFALVEHLLRIITELSDLCEKKNWDIKSIPTFDLRSNDWQIAMLQIYEQLYFKDCKKVRQHQDNIIRAGLHKDGKLLRGLPAHFKCFSKILKPFLMHLHGRRIRLMPVPNTKESRQMKDLPIPVVKIEREIDDNELYMIENRLNDAHVRIHDEVFGLEIKKVIEDEKPAVIQNDDQSQHPWSEDDKSDKKPSIIITPAKNVQNFQTLDQQKGKTAVMVSASKLGGIDMNEIMPPEMQGQPYGLKQKNQGRRREKEAPPSSEYIWPFKDSYVPNAKMLPQDAKLIKNSLKLNHFPKPHDKQQLTVSKLKERARAMRAIGETYKIRVNNQVGKVLNWEQEERRKASTSSGFSDGYKLGIRKSPTNTLKLPLILGDNQAGNLVKQFNREQRIKDRKVPAKVQSGIRGGFIPVRGKTQTVYKSMASPSDTIQKLAQDQLNNQNSQAEVSQIEQDDSANEEETNENPLQIVENPRDNAISPSSLDIVDQADQISDERIMPGQLLDYDPIANGFKFTLEALQNLPEHETSIFKVTAQINSYSFNIDEPNVEKSIGGQYYFDHSAQPVMYQKLTANSCIIYFITKHDVITGKTTNNFAYAIQPLIHIMRERQFLICGKYYLPLYYGFPPKELFDTKLQIRKTLKSVSQYLIPNQSIIVRTGDANEGQVEDGLPSFLHCLVDRSKFPGYEACKVKGATSLKEKLLKLDDGQGKWMGLVQKARKSMLKA